MSGFVIFCSCDFDFNQFLSAFAVSRHLQGQVKVPDGYVFDNDAFQRDQINAARNPNGVAPDPSKYYKPPSGSLSSDTSGIVAAERARLDAIKAANGALRVGTPSTPGVAAPSSAPAPATSTTVNIVINGRSTPVTVATGADATTLQRLLQQLALEAMRTGP